MTTEAWAVISIQNLAHPGICRRDDMLLIYPIKTQAVAERDKLQAEVDRHERGQDAFEVVPVNIVHSSFV